MSRVIFQTSTFTLIVGAILFLIGKFKTEWIYEYQWLLVLYFFVLTLISLMIVEKTAKKDVDQISKGFFGAMMLRFFLSIILALVVIYFDRDGASVFAVNFIILYLLYLGFEIFYLINHLQLRINGGK